MVSNIIILSTFSSMISNTTYVLDISLKNLYIPLRGLIYEIREILITILNESDLDISHYNTNLYYSIARL